MKNTQCVVIDRIDFEQLEDGRTVILKLQAREGRDIPVEHKIHPPGFDLEIALAWCEAHGYTVRRWAGGARAWLGAPRPVRTTHQILSRRAARPGSQMDFALDG